MEVSQPQFCGKYWCSSAIRSSQAARMQQAVYQLPLRMLQQARVQMLIVPVLVAPIKEVCSPDSSPDHDNEPGATVALCSYRYRLSCRSVSTQGQEV